MYILMWVTLGDAKRWVPWVPWVGGGYAATQSNKPDEIVLLTAGQRLLEAKGEPKSLGGS